MTDTKDFKKILLSEPHVILGKKGINEEFVQHLTKLLKRYKIIKIKALKSIINKSNIKDLAKKASDLTNTHLLDVRGYTFIISKFPINKK